MFDASIVRRFCGSRADRSFRADSLDAATVRGADRDRVGETETREIGLESLVFRVIDLVDHEHDRRFRFAQDAREFLIDRRETVLRIDDEENEVALAHGGIGRGAHLRGQFRLARAADSAGIPDHERPRAAHCRGRQPIARDARLIMHNRDVAPGEPIEKRRFADIRTADDGDVAGMVSRVAFMC